MAIKKLLPVFGFVMLWLGSLAGQAQETIVLNANTVVPVRILTQVTSDDYLPVQAIVDKAVTDSAGNEIIKAGTEVVLQITKEPSRGSGRPGKVIIAPLRVTTTDGQTAVLEGITTFVGEDRHDAVLLGALGGCLFFGPPALLILLIKGRPAYVYPGYLLLNVVVKSVE